MPLRILLADESPVVRQAVKGLLEREGFSVIAEAADGHEALRLAEALDPDVVVLDFVLPGLNGLDVVRGIQRVASRASAIFLTTHTEEYLVHTALRVGVRGYVLKSRAAEELVPAIQEVARGAIYVSPGMSGGEASSSGLAAS